MADYRLVDATQLDADLTTVADAIREKAGTSDALTFPDGMAAAVENIPTGGGEDYLRYVATAQFNDLNVFGKASVEITLENAVNLGNLFSSKVTNTTVEHITLTCFQQVTNANAMFYALAAARDDTLKHITLNVDFSQSTYMASFFLNCHALEVVDGTPIDTSGATITGVNDLPQLREIRFAEKTIKGNILFKGSTKLSADSIRSIVNGLSDTTTGLTATLSRTAVNTAFETSAGAADGSTSAAWLALIGTRSNWTISLA